MFSFSPLQGAQSESTASQSILELDGGVKVLIDVGWDESFNVEKLRELEKCVAPGREWQNLKVVSHAMLTVTFRQTSANTLAYPPYPRYYVTSCRLCTLLQEYPPVHQDTCLCHKTGHRPGSHSDAGPLLFDTSRGNNDPTCLAK